MAMNEDPIQGTPQDDYLQGTSGDDTIYGMGGNDSLYGRAGNDILVGGGGNDYLEGGTGNDVYRFERGFGQDYLYNYDQYGDGQEVDVVEFGAGIAPSEIVLERAGNQLGIRIAGTGDVIWVQSFFADGSGYDYAIDEIRFADGTVWNTAEIRARQLVGTDADQYLGGTEGDDTIDGAGGSDDIYGYGGNDTLSGGSGNDNVNGGEGDDTVDGGIGSDSVYGEDGNDTVRGGSGEDQLYGGAGDDILIGGTGADHMDGSTGNDIYRFAAGFGHDAISNLDYYSDGQDNDIVEFEAGISPSQVEVLKQSNDLVIRINGGADTLIINGFFEQWSTGYDRKIDGVRFADGTVWDTNELIRQHLIGNDTDQDMSGTDGDDVIDGGGGNDTISGNNGNDTLLGGGGNDQLFGGQGNDTITGGAGSSYIDGGDGDDTLTGDSDYDTLYGDSGNDILVGGGGSYDSLSGGSGSDTYRFARGDGYDQINDSHDQGSLDHDVLEFGPGIDTSEILLLRDGNSLLLRIFGSDDTVYMGSYFQSSWNYGVDEIRFDDGTQWTRNDVIDRVLVPVSGSNASETLKGDASNDFLDGGYGDDELQALAGNDLLLGGLGNDRMDGGVGDDTYLLLPGAGSDVISNFDDHSDGLDFDTVKFDAGVAAEDMTVASIDHDLVLTNSVTGDTVTIAGFFDEDPTGTSDRQIDQVKFHDGTAWSAEDLILKQMVGSGADQVMHGRAVGDTLDASAGNDFVYGHDGDDVLIGGLGDDSLIGGKGSDTYSFELGWGRDVIDNTAPNAGAQDADAIEFGAGILPADIAVSSNGPDLVLSSAATGDSITILNFFGADGQAGAGRLQQVRFADTTTWDIAELIARQMVGTDADQYMHGTEGGDSIDASNGNDLVYGHAGDDSLVGGDGDDTLDGGLGNDLLDGGEGNDVFVFAAGRGHDRIVSSDEYGIYYDLIQFGEGILAEQVTVEKHGRDLVFKLEGGEDSLTVINFYPATGDGYPEAFDEVWFHEGTVWDLPYVLSVAVDASEIVGTEGDDVLVGTEGGESILGLGGNDQLSGSGGDDILVGGAGNDAMDGGVGNDTYRFEVGSGVDTLVNHDVPAGLDSDVIEFGEGISASDIQVRGGFNYGLVLTNTVTGDVINVIGYGSPEYFGSDNRIDEVRFFDGTVWTRSYLDSLLKLATMGDDVLIGTAADETLDGLGGNDMIYGGDGDDILIAGANAGIGMLRGDHGDDIYRLDAGWTEVFIDNAGAATDFDVVEFGAGVLATDLAVMGDGERLWIRDANTGDVLLVGTYYAEGAPIDEYRFADGTVWTEAQIGQLAWTNAGDYAVLGTSGADVLDGASGNDTLLGYGGDDTLVGGADQDQLFGGSGNDTLSGDAGDDVLNGGMGDDAMDGGDGSDTFVFNAGFGHDTLVSQDALGLYTDSVRFGGGIDPDNVDLARNGNDLVLTVGQDSLTIQGFFVQAGGGAPSAIDEVRFNDGTVWDVDYIMGLFPSGGEHITGTAGDDTLQGTAGDDTIEALAGNDQVAGGAGDDLLIGGEGDDTLLGNDGNAYVGNDTLFGGNGNDTLYVGYGDDVLSGGEGNDQLIDDGGSDIFLFEAGWGQDAIFNMIGGLEGFDAVKFGSGIEADDIVASTNGYDVFLTHRISGDSIRLDAYAQVYQNGSPNDDGRIDEIQFADGTVWDKTELAAWLSTGTAAGEGLMGTDGNDTIHAGAGDDRVFGYWGDDVLNGEAGADELTGGHGADTLYGGSGNDLLIGDNGDDTYRFELGDGLDVVKRTGNESDYSSMGYDSLVFGAGIAAADITVHMEENTLVLTNIATGDIVRVNDFVFYAEWDMVDDYTIDEIRFADGTVWNVPHILALLADDGVITGTEQDDVLIGTELGENIEGRGGIDEIHGAAGNDILIGGNGSDYLYGEEGDDIIIGGIDADFAIGGEGNDAYRFELGWGTDTLANYDSNANGAEFDSIEFGVGISASDIEVSTNGSSVVLTHRTYGDSISIGSWALSSDAPDGYNNEIDEVRFIDGTVWNTAYIAALLMIGDDTDQALIGTHGDDVIDALAGNDQVYGGDGNDTLSGGVGDDSIMGGDGDDTITGGSGADYVRGEEGNDTYRFELGWGMDHLVNLDRNANGAGFDVIEFGAGISASDIAVSTDGHSVILTHRIYGDQVSIDNWRYSSDAPDGYNAEIDEVRFIDGTVWNTAYIAALLMIGDGTDQALIGTHGDDVIDALAGNDQVYGRGGNDMLSGGDGSDYLYGEDGNDIITGGSGADYVYGEEGNDTYRFELGWGMDQIANHDNNANGAGFDVIEFGAGISASDIAVSTNGSSVFLTHRIYGDQISIGNWRYSSDAPDGYNTEIDEVRFIDGTVWNTAYIAAMLMAGDATDQTLIGTYGDDVIDALAGNDQVYGRGGNDMLSGGEGSDYLYGEDGNDVITGGSGADYVYGEEGNDTYRFELGWGMDRLANYDNNANGAGFDVIEFGAAISASDIAVSTDGSSVFLTHRIYGDQISIDNWLQSSDADAPGSYNTEIDEVRFIDGTVWNTPYIAAMLMAGDATDQTLIGTYGDDVIDALAGDDYVYGGAGDDVLNGEAGNDVLSGGSGDDVLNGEAGNDVLSGGSGDDIYKFELGSGQDTIGNYDDSADGFDTDEIQLGSGILPSNTFLEIYGDDLFVRVGGTTDSLNVYGHFLPQSNDGGNFSIEGIRFANGTFWDRTYIDTHATFPNSLTTGGGMESLALANESMDEERGVRADERAYARNRMTQSLPAELGGRGQHSAAVDFNEIHRLVDTMSVFGGGGGGQALLPDSGGLYEIRWPMASGQMF